MRATFAVLSLALFIIAAPRSALADDEGGSWFVLEYRQPLVGRAPSLPRLALRIQSETRLLSRAPAGLYEQYLRFGLQFEVTPWLWISPNGTVEGARNSMGGYEVEGRLEMEVYFTPHIGPVYLYDRNRVEWRYRDNIDSRLRYRNQLRVQIQPKGWVVRPFVWNEWLVDAHNGFNENRFVAGINWILPNGTPVDIGYLFRVRPDAQWSWSARDHVLWVQFVIGVPFKSKPAAK